MGRGGKSGGPRMNYVEIKAWVEENFPDQDMFNRTFAIQTISKYQANPLMLEHISRGSEQPYWTIVRAWLES